MTKDIDVIRDVAIGYFGAELVNNLSANGVIITGTHFDPDTMDTIFNLDDNGIHITRDFHGVKIFYQHIKDLYIDCNV